MSAPTEIRNAIAANLKAHFGDGVQVLPRPLAQPTPPTVYVRSGPIQYDRAMGRGHDDHTYVVVALVANTTDEGSQLLLDEYMAPTGPRSVKQAVERDPLLGGLADDTWVEECSGAITYSFDLVSTGGAQRPSLLGAEWTVRIIN